MVIAKAFGVLGLVLIILGVITKRRKRNEQRKLQDLYYVFGGLSLLVYSISLRDFIFIILQVVFVFAASYDFFRLQKGR